MTTPGYEPRPNGPWADGRAPEYLITAADLNRMEANAEGAHERLDNLGSGGGEGTVTSVNGVEPDGSGNVTVPIPDSPDDIGAQPAGDYATTDELGDAIATRTALSVGGTFVETYDISTDPVAPGDLTPPAYTQDEVDDLIAGAGGGAGPWVPVQDTTGGVSTDYTTTSSAVVAGLSVTITADGVGDVYRVEALVDLASYTTNAGAIIIHLTTDGAWSDTNRPIRFPANGHRDIVPAVWIVSGLSAGSHTFGLAAYLTAAGNYQVGTGTTMIVERKA